MPTYEYECTRCGRTFEVFQSITARPKTKLAVDCAECDNQAPVRRLVGTGGAVIFRGSGFYATDYRSESYKRDAKAESEKSGGEKTGPAAKLPSKGDKPGKTGTEPSAASG